MQIIQAEESDIPALQTIKNHPEDVFQTYFGRGTVFLLLEEGVPAGYVFLNQKPKYHLYARLGIAEIQDLNVHSDYRRRGHAKKLIQHCENLAREAGDEMIGISVGLTAEYGLAQILYASIGYHPDGNGVTVDRGQVAHGTTVKLDDDLCLMLIKTLQQQK